MSLVSYVVDLTFYTFSISLQILYHYTMLKKVMLFEYVSHNKTFGFPNLRSCPYIK